MHSKCIKRKIQTKKRTAEEEEDEEKKLKHRNNVNHTSLKDVWGNALNGCDWVEFELVGLIMVSSLDIPLS